jgi:hypothetical protein
MSSVIAMIRRCAQHQDPEAACPTYAELQFAYSTESATPSSPDYLAEERPPVTPDQEVLP